MNIEEATEKYEAWLAKRIRLLKADLALKHKSMREGVFPFLRSLGTGKEGRLRLDPEGIPKRLAAGGRSIVLGEHHHGLRELAISETRSPSSFGRRCRRCPRGSRPYQKAPSRRWST